MAHITRQYRGMAGRLGDARGGSQISDLWPQMIPVKQIGPVEWDDFALPLWGCTGDTSIGAPVPPWFHNLSITSDFDLAISGIHTLMFSPPGLTPANSNMTLGVPPDIFDLFEITGLAFRAGLRPTIRRFQSFNTAVISSWTTVPNPLVCELGWQSMRIDVDTFGLYLNPNGLFPYAQSTRQVQGMEWTFDPPLILPAGVFLTAEPGFSTVEHRTTFFYREMPTTLQPRDRP